jgi:integrase
MKLLLTDRFCQHAKSTTPQTDFFDETVTGLALRVTKQGTKAWTFNYTRNSRRSRMTLGRYPSIPLARARTLASEASAAIAEGRDPSFGSAMTVAALAERYIQHVNRLRSAKEIERRLRTDVLPIIGNVSLTDLHRRDATRVIDAKAEAPIGARRAFDDLRAMLRWAVSRGDLDHSPIEGMKSPAGSEARERVLSDDEIRALWLALPNRPMGQVIKLCLVTGQRVGEVVGMKRSELDFKRKLWELPGSRTKNGHAHSVPLSPLALELIPTSSDRVFPIARARHVSQMIKRQQSFGLQPFTPHDLRRSVLTGMAKLGVAPIVLGHVANHRTTTKAGITLGVYVQHQFEREKREALELWADRLQHITT